MIKTNEKAGTVATVTGLRNHSIAGGNQKTFSTFDYRQARHSSQCKRCGSDYMNFHTTIIAKTANNVLSSFAANTRKF
jgi:hypothetical protein